ncbi:MAG: helix-turn-helix domain-containing protein [Bacteriovoracia bacterium]
MAKKERSEHARNRGKEFGKRLRKVREQKDLSRNDLSKIADIPVDTISSIEGGRILSPGLFIAADLVHALEGNLNEWVKNQRRQKGEP